MIDLPAVGEMTTPCSPRQVGALHKQSRRRVLDQLHDVDCRKLPHVPATAQEMTILKDVEYVCSSDKVPSSLFKGNQSQHHLKDVLR